MLTALNHLFTKLHSLYNFFECHLVLFTSVKLKLKIGYIEILRKAKSVMDLGPLGREIIIGGVI